MRYCPSCHSVYPNEFRTCPKDQTELVAASELQPGMVLRGKYEILGKLGAGGMATVYSARHLAFGEVRAIKVVGSRLSDDEDFLKRFRNEAVVARRLQHPNAVRVDDLDTTEDGRPFIVMEYVEGHNLREVVRREGPLSLRRSVRIARQVASALTAAHELGIVHRDIKPDNILLTGTGEAETAKVLDFGIAKVKEGSLSDAHMATRTGMVVGTPQYISPEQAMGRRGSELDGRADLYSLGVVLYEMVTGRLPFESDTAMGMILHHLQTPPPQASDVRPDLGIPGPLSDVLTRALEKDREKRFASAAEMGAALDSVLALPLPDRPEGEAVAGTAGRPLTPRPVPADIDRRETRALPRTPPSPTSAPVPVAATAPRTPPPSPSTPIPAPTMYAPGRPGSASTPVPSPTILSARPQGTAATPPPLPPPPVLPQTTVFTPPPGKARRKRPWWVWVVAVAILYSVCHRTASRAPARRDQEASPPAAAEADPGAHDKQIHDDVTRALHDDPRTRKEDIDVEVDEGVVTLSGHAPADVARGARQVATGVPNVRRVVSEIDTDVEAAGRSGPGPGAGPPTIPSIAVPVPPSPPLAGIHPIWPGVRPEQVAEMLREGHRALDRGAAEEAMGIFTGVLALDPMNKDAQQGMRDAGKMMGDRGRAAGQAAREAARERRRSLPPPPSPQ